MKQDLIACVRKELKACSDTATRKSARRFFKEQVKLYGVKTVAVSRVAKKYYREIRDRSKDEIFSLCEKLLRSDYSEEAYIAFDWAYRQREDYVPEDFKLFERWIERYINTWAKCDVFCGHVVGAFIDGYPHYIGDLKRWTGSRNRWLRRGAAVSLIPSVRGGEFIPDVFEISDALLRDTDDLVRKGYGWLLKEASKTHLREVFAYVMKHTKDMPRTALRYAIEKMPRDLRARAMKH